MVVEVVALAGGPRREAPWQRCRAGSRESPRLRISEDQTISKALAVTIVQTTHIPKGRPAHKIGMVDLALRIDMLSRAHRHVLGRGHVDQRGFTRIGMGDPY